MTTNADDDRTRGTDSNSDDHFEPAPSQSEPPLPLPPANDDERSTNPLPIAWLVPRTKPPLVIDRLSVARRLRLSDGESQVLCCLAEGLKKPEIARRLGIATGTVRKWTDRSFSKLDCHTVQALSSSWLATITNMLHNGEPIVIELPPADDDNRP